MGEIVTYIGTAGIFISAADTIFGGEKKNLKQVLVRIGLCFIFIVAGMVMKHFGA